MWRSPVHRISSSSPCRWASTKTGNPLCQGGSIPCRRGGEDAERSRRAALPTGCVQRCLCTPSAGRCGGWQEIWNCPLCLPEARSWSRCRKLSPNPQGRAPRNRKRQSLARGRPRPCGDAAGGLRMAVSGGGTGGCPRQGQRHQPRPQSRADHAGTPCLSLQGRTDRRRDGHGSARFSGTCGLCRACCCQAAGTLEEAILAERQRQVDRQLVAPEIAEKLNAGRSAALPRAKPLQDLRIRKGAAGAGLHHGAARAAVLTAQGASAEEALP